MEEVEIMEKPLEGGRDDIIRDFDVVYRPAHEWTVHVHDFLDYLHDSGFNQVPYPKGVTEDFKEIVSFVEGEVFNEKLPQLVKSDTVLIEFAMFIRRYHDLGAKYVEGLKGDEKWMLPVQTRVETMCHGDLAPYNTAILEGSISGLIDFDTLHPGSRLWDLAYALYRWIPLMSNNNPENFGSELDKSRRINLFMEAYGRDMVDWDQLYKYVIRRLEFLITFMEEEVAKGDETFEKHIEDGHIKGYRNDINYVRQNWLK